MTIDLIVNLAISTIAVILQGKMTAKARAKVVTQLKRLVTFGQSAIDALTANDEQAIAKLAKKQK